MLLKNLSDSIITDQQFTLLCIGIFLAATIVVGLIILLAMRLIRPLHGRDHQKLGLLQAIAIATLLVGAFVLAALVIPTIIRDKAWRDKQNKCAKQVGYSSPADNNSSRATAATQAAYRQCLE